MSVSNPCTVVQVTSDEQFASLTSSIPASALKVLYFHAPWAAPCAQMSAVLDALASTYEATEPPKISFLSINAEELPELSEDHEVTAVPFVVLRQNDKTLETVSGSDATRVRTAVEKHFGGANTNQPGTQLPPYQQVTRPAQQPVPEIPNSTAADPTQPIANGTNSGTTRNMSSYMPSQTDTALEKDTTSKDQLWERLKELTNAAPCMLFMKGTPSAPQCGFSRQLVSILRENSVRYGFFNILADEDVRQGLKEYAEWPTFPQLWMSGDLVGGLDIVREELETDPGFFKEYSIDTTRNNMGGPASADQQARPTAAA